MKRMTALLFALLLLLSLCACSFTVTGSMPITDILGQISDSTYTNEYFGIGCTLEDDWRFYPDTVDEWNGLDPELPRESVLAAVMAEYGHIYDLYAKPLNGRAALIIEICDLTEYGESYTAEDLAEALRVSLSGSYTAAGHTVVSAQVTQTGFAGQLCPAAELHTTLYSQDWYMTTVVMRSGGLFITFEVSARSREAITEVLNAFYPLEGLTTL